MTFFKHTAAVLCWRIYLTAIDGSLLISRDPIIHRLVVLTILYSVGVVILPSGESASATISGNLVPNSHRDRHDMQSTSQTWVPKSHLDRDDMQSIWIYSDLAKENFTIHYNRIYMYRPIRCWLQFQTIYEYACSSWNDRETISVWCYLKSGVMEWKTIIRKCHGAITLDAPNISCWRIWYRPNAPNFSRTPSIFVDGMAIW